MLRNGLSLTIFAICGVVALITLYYLFIVIKEIFTGKRRFESKGISGFTAFVTSLVLMAGVAYCLYNAPYVLFNGLSWEMIEEWGPSVLINTVLSLAFVIPIFYLYFILTYFFVKPDDRPFFMIIVMGIISGFGNSLVVFIINEALNRSINSQTRRIGIESGLYVYFALGILIFTVCAMVVRKKLILITNNIVYEKRMDIINRIIKAPYQKFEAIEGEKTYAALNNDTEAVGAFVNTFVNGLTGIITLITCFVYLGTINLYGLALSLLIILFSVGVFTAVSRTVETYFKKNRNIQDAFFKNIGDMIRGFKELYINRTKRSEFYDDIKNSCQQYKDTRIQGEFKFVGAGIMGEILYIFVIGLVVFVFPIIFERIQGNTLRSYVLVYLYMGGIVNQEIYLIPGLIRIKVSWDKINEYIDSLLSLEEVKQSEALKYEEGVEIKLKGVKYSYKTENGECFTVGPIDYTFKSGEMVFISGGNGSGKSTLAKLITGLYEPDEGEILVNGKSVDGETLGNYYSTVYSDFHLFDRLYGIDYKEKREKIEKYLKILRIDDKVQINEGFFSTLKLSTGQRKRLALLMCYLEDRPAMLFDEWAADQDPEFRKFFYKELLPELKAKGKLVVAITHDDRYFDDADKHIKMETGRIVGQEEVQHCEGLGVVNA